MLLKIDFESEIPIYIQVKNQIIEGIANKELLPGDSLPSVRQLAEDIGINMHTANKAYSLLKDLGFISIHKRKGVIISELQVKADEKYVGELKEEIKPIITEAFCKGIKKEEFLDICNKIFELYNKGE